MNCKQIVRIICYFISGRGQQIPVKFLRDIMAELLPFETAKLLTLKALNIMFGTCQHSYVGQNGNDHC